MHVTNHLSRSKHVQVKTSRYRCLHGHDHYTASMWQCGGSSDHCETTD